MSKKPKRWIIGVLAAILILGGLYGIGVYRETHPDPDVGRLFQVLGLRMGMTAAEIGAGQGRMTVSMARRLGPMGQVLSTDIDPQSVREIRAAAAAAGLQNVTVIEGAEHTSNLPQQCCDAIWMSNVYHHFTDPGGVDASLFRALRPGGQLAVIDFAASRWRFWLPKVAGVPQNRGSHGVPKEIVIQELSSAGLRVERIIDDWWLFPDHRFCIVFRKKM